MSDVRGHEPPDLDLLDDDDQHREVFAWAGRALYYAQVFEQGVINTLYAARLGDGSLAGEFASADQFFASHGHLVLGRLLDRLKKHLPLPADVVENCEEALRRRNFLVHHFFAERIELFVAQPGRQLLLCELNDTIRVLQEGDEHLERLMLAIMAGFGVTREAVLAQVERMTKEATPP